MFLGAAALAATMATAPTGASAATTTTSTAAATTRSASTTYVVLAKDGVSAARVVKAVRAAGGTVTRTNRAIGLVSVTSTRASFARTLARSGLVDGVAPDVAIGRAPKERLLKPSAVELKAARAALTNRTVTPQNTHPRPGPHTSAGSDPLDSKLWGLRMIHADEAHAVQAGDRRVLVGDIDTGMDAKQPDIAPNFDAALSRNFTVDIPAIDGPCEYAGCKDPANVDGAEHGTHTAGTIAAAANGLGVSGVAPKVTLVNLRAGQDSGYFFLQPTVDALTYAADHGIDVVNMSFYVDPWLFNCPNNPADTPAQQAEQRLIIKAMNKALKYAYHHRVTLVSAAGNDVTDLANPSVDETSPDYPPDTEHTRTIDPKTCVSEPTQGPNVISVTSLGPSGRKAYYSNWGFGEVDLAAPGGDYRDFYGTSAYRTNGNLVLSTYPVEAMQAEGLVDANGHITPDGTALGVIEQCAAGVTDYHRCGWYGWLQGTSMASPHVAGVAALIVSQYGKGTTQANFSMRPKEVARVLEATATDTACPTPATFTYPGLPADYTATCTGTARYNSFYGYGIVNAYAAVTLGKAHPRP